MTNEARQRAEAMLQTYCGADDEEWAVAKRHNAAFEAGLVKAIATYGASEYRRGLEAKLHSVELAAFYNSGYRRGLEAAAKRVEQILEVERHSTPDERIGDGSVQTLGVVLDHLDDAMAELYRLAQEGL